MLNKLTFLLLCISISQSLSKADGDEEISSLTIEKPSKPKQVQLPKAAVESSDTDKDSTATKKAIVHHHTNCSYLDHYCNPTAMDLIAKVEDVDVSSPMDCRDLCLKEEGCTDFTYFNFRGIRTCFLLSGCNDKKPRCTQPNNCVSGRKDCKDGKFCAKLTQKPGADIAWRCQSGVNPYKEDIPQDTPCYIYCPSWENHKGKTVVAKSICQADGSWSEPKAYPPGDLKYPNSLNKPDNEVMGCGCHALNMTYNPNDEEGTEFYCENDVNWEDLPQKIDTNNKCTLFCDKESQLLGMQK